MFCAIRARESVAALRHHVGPEVIAISAAPALSLDDLDEGGGTMECAEEGQWSSGSKAFWHSWSRDPKMKELAIQIWKSSYMPTGSFVAGLLSSLVLVFLLIASCHPAPCSGLLLPDMQTVGGRQNIPGAQNDVELENLAKYAVDQYNSKQNSDIKYVSLVSAQQQVVAGIMYYLDLKARLGDHTKLFEAKVWVKSWENFKSLEGFREIQNSVTRADLGSNLDTNSERTGLHAVSFDDPIVKEAAKEALKGLQQRSNSLIPYELRNVLSACVEVTQDHTNFDLIIKVQRGSKEEQFKAEISRTVLGAWSVRDVRLHH